MIIGRMEHRHALLPVVFRLPDAPDLSIDFVVDTGFTDALCLPMEAVAVLRLPFEFDFPATLADGSQVSLPTYKATILWEGVEQDVRLLGTGTRPLLGTALLDGKELVIQFIENGLVTADVL